MRLPARMFRKNVQKTKRPKTAYYSNTALTYLSGESVRNKASGLTYKCMRTSTPLGRSIFISSSEVFWVGLIRYMSLL